MFKLILSNLCTTILYTDKFVFAASFCFGALASLIFVVYFVILFFTSTNNSSKNSAVILKTFYTLPFPLKRDFTKENMHQIPDLLLQENSFARVFLIKLQVLNPGTLFKRDFSTVIFL